MSANTIPSQEKMDPLIRGLLRPEAYDHLVQQFELLETHISWVILTGEFAYKLKKPVNFGFVDFTTLPQRQFCCHEELRLNRRQAQDLYLAVRPVYGPRQQASFCGTGEPIEYAVQMRQFSQKDLLPQVLARGELKTELLDALAVDVAAFQRTAGIAREDDWYGSGSAIRQVVHDNFTALVRDGREVPTVGELRDWCQREFLKRELEFARRKSNGRVREGHGDMHLGNMVYRHQRIEVFDCLEFNPSLRWIDVISEIAFLVMDLADRGRPDLGWRFLNAWLEQTGDYGGLQVWAWYFCYRALVRAKVATLRRQQSDVTEAEAAQLDQQRDEYLRLALSVTKTAKPVLIITHGVSGSGKSHWTQRLAAELGMIRIRSDVERKRLYGHLEQFSKMSGDLYSEAATSRTYLHLKSLARVVLNSGWSVIIDATFLRRSQRQEFQKLARELGVRSCLLSFQASEPTLKQRVAQRMAAGHDPSDATLDVLAGQLASLEPIQPDQEGDRKLETSEPVSDLFQSEGWNVIPIDTEIPETSERISAAVRQFLNASLSLPIPDIIC